MPRSHHTPFADYLRAELLRTRMTQVDLAARLGVSQQTVSKWLNGETRPRLELLPGLADVLGARTVDISALLIGDGDEPSSDETVEERVAAIARGARRLTPAQLDRLEAYLRGLLDGPP